MPQRPRPTVVVLLAGADRPPGVSAIEQHALVRYANEDRLADELPGADVLFVWGQRAGAVAKAWPKADALRWVHLAGAGTEALTPVEVPGEVVVTNSRGLFDQPIAEYVLGLVLAFAKELPGRLRLQDARGWERLETERVTGKHVLVAGTGSIGRAIGRQLSADAFVKQDGRRPGLIKIDTEGNEAAVLEGGRDTLREARPWVIFESWHDDSRERLYGLFEHVGYHISPLPFQEARSWTILDRAALAAWPETNFMARPIEDASAQ